MTCETVPLRIDMDLNNGPLSLAVANSSDALIPRPSHYSLFQRDIHSLRLDKALSPPVPKVARHTNYRYLVWADLPPKLVTTLQ
jgi:hypothetical protein